MILAATYWRAYIAGALWLAFVVLGSRWFFKKYPP